MRNSCWTSVPLQAGLILATWKPMCLSVWGTGCACSQQELPAFSWPQEIKAFPILKKHQGSRPAPQYWKQFPLSKASLLLIFFITGNLKSQQNVLCVFLLFARFRKKEIFEVFLTENTQSLPPPYTLSVQLSSRDWLLPWEAKMAQAMNLHPGLIILTASNDKCSN